MPSVVAIVPHALLTKLAAKRLLALRDRLLACEESLADSDVYPEDVASEIDPTKIRFKDDPRWGLLYNAIKAELSTREHVPRGNELRAQRRARRPQGSQKGRPRQRKAR
jgi:hypothetical protein